MNRSSAITMKQLRALSSVARHGSIAAASRQLNLTAPAVHNQIKMLEEALDTVLLERSADSAGSRLTPAGQVMLRAADRIEVTLSQGLQQIDELQRGQLGRITLGVVSTAKYFAPGLVKSLKLLHPALTIILDVGNRDSILNGIETGALDLAIMGRPPRAPRVDALPLGPHPHGIVAAPDHPLAGRAALSWADLRNETFITREEGSGTRILMQRYLDQLGEGEIYQTYEMGSNETIKQAIMAGLGIAFLSLHTVVSELRQKSIVRLDTPNTPIERHWFLVCPADRALDPATQGVLDTIQRLDGAFLPSLPGVA